MNRCKQCNGEFYNPTPKAACPSCGPFEPVKCVECGGEVNSYGDCKICGVCQGCFKLNINGKCGCIQENK